MKKTKFPKIYADPLCFAGIALVCIFDTEALIAILAAFLHELGHITAVALSGRRISEIRISPLGAEIKLSATLSSYADDIFISLSGPLANLFGMIPHFIFPYSHFCSIFALCNFSLMAFNLFPISGLDGGNALKSALVGSGNERSLSALKICGYISAAALFAMWIYAIYSLFFYSEDITLLAACFYLFEATVLRGDDFRG